MIAATVILLLLVVLVATDGPAPGDDAEDRLAHPESDGAGVGSPLAGAFPGRAPAN